MAPMNLCVCMCGAVCVAVWLCGWLKAWSKSIKNAGWVWAPKRVVAERKHERLLPFEFLSEQEQQRLMFRAECKVRQDTWCTALLVWVSPM